MKKEHKPGELFEKNRMMKMKHKKGLRPASAVVKSEQDASHQMYKKGKKSMKKKNWIKDAIKKPGALKKELGVKAGKKIPAAKLAKATKASGKEGKRARLAETLKGFQHKKGKKMKAKKEMKMKKGKKMSNC